MTKDEALKLALQALETLMIERGSIYDKAITAIKEALANVSTNDTSQERVDKTSESVHEPVAWYRDEDGIRIYYETKCWDDATPLYTTPQHTWVGLTFDERNNIWDTIGNSDAHGDVDGWSGRDVMKAIEAALKAKNT